MVKKSFNVQGSRLAAVLRCTAVAASVLLLIAGGGCRRQGDAGPRYYDRERAGIRETAGQRLEYGRTGPPDRYPWRGKIDPGQGKYDPGLERLSERIVELETRLKQESDEHYLVIHGRRKQP